MIWVLWAIVKESSAGEVARMYTNFPDLDRIFDPNLLWIYRWLNPRIMSAKTVQTDSDTTRSLLSLALTAFKGFRRLW